MMHQTAVLVARKHCDGLTMDCVEREGGDWILYAWDADGVRIAIWLGVAR